MALHDPSPAHDPQRSSAPPLLCSAGRVVVTGGAGFVGSHLVGELLRRGHRVHVVDDLSTGRSVNPDAVAGHPSPRVTVASVVRPDVCASMCAGADAVVHLAGVAGVQRLAAEPLAVMRCNLHTTEQVVAAAAAAGIGVLFTSSS